MKSIDSIPESFASSRVFGVKLPRTTKTRLIKDDEEAKNNNQDLLRSISEAASNLEQDDMNTAQSKSELKWNTITIFGVTSEKYEEVKGYFSRASPGVKYEPSGSFSETVGNWAVLTFNKDVRSIPCVKPTVHPTKSPNYAIKCFVGRFPEDELIPVPNPDLAQKPKRPKIFKEKSLDEDVTASPLEKKSFYLLLREFIFGEGEIRGSSSAPPYPYIVVGLLLFLMLIYYVFE